MSSAGGCRKGPEPDGDDFEVRTRPNSQTGKQGGKIDRAVTYRLGRVRHGFDQDRMSRGQTALVVTCGTRLVKGTEN